MPKNWSKLNVVYLWCVNQLVKQGLHFCHAFFDELGEAFGVLQKKIKKNSFSTGDQLGKKGVKPLNISINFQFESQAFHVID